MGKAPRNKLGGSTAAGQRLGGTGEVGGAGKRRLSIAWRSHLPRVANCQKETSKTGYYNTCPLTKLGLKPSHTPGF